MLLIYVGDSGDVVKRIRTNHCSGNVEGSALRKRVAEHMGYTLNVTKRPRGSSRIRLNLPDPRVGEQTISKYIRSGLWKFAICMSPEEAKDFQWYVIDKLNPMLNEDRRIWVSHQERRYVKLLTVLTESPHYTYNDLAGQKTGPGVYVLYHKVLPPGAYAEQTC